MKFCHEEIGCFDDRLRVIFKDLSSARRFSVVRPLRAVIGSEVDHALFQPRAPYVPRKHKARGEIKLIVPGVPNAARRSTRLPKAEIPTVLSEKLEAKIAPAALAETFKYNDMLPKVLSIETYVKHFQTLLWVEEFQMQ